MLGAVTKISRAKVIDMLDILPFQKPKIHSLYNISFKTCSEEVFEWEQPVVFSGENALSDGSWLHYLQFFIFHQITK